MEFLIKPRFSSLRGALYFETDTLNALVEAEYNDKFGFYQRQFGVYSYMTLTENLTYRMHYPKGTPFMWQPHNSCAWTPTGTLSMDTDEITPCKAKINEQFCYDEHLDGSYKAFLQWSGSPQVGMSAAGVQATNAFIRTIGRNATLGHRMTLSGGQLMDLSSVTFKEGTKTRIEEAYRRTAGTCKGWIELTRDLAANEGITHLDGGYITAADISTNGEEFVGDNRDIVDLYDEMFNASTGALRDAIVEGGVGGFGDMFYPLWIVAMPEYRAVYQAYLAQKQSAQLEEARIRRMPFQVQTERGSRTIYVFMIDETVVVPMTEISMFDRWLTGTAHFAYLTLSGVIQLGSNFANIPVPGESEVAMMIQQSQDAEDLGTYKFLSHSLMATAINDTDYITGDYLFAEPA